MISLAQLWMPLLLAAVLVFVASSVIHMVFQWHKPDYRKLANEDEVRAAIRSSNPGPGKYVIPYCMDPKEMQKPEMMQRYVDGPVGFVMLGSPGAPSMGKPLGSWFVLNLVVALLVGYLASRTLAPGASFLAVARVVGLTTFLAYACGGPIQSIWMARPWGDSAKDLLDAFIYGLVSAAAFGWLWPR